MKNSYWMLPLWLVACDRPAPAPADVPTPTPTPHEALAALDARTPVPLQPMMAWHQKQNMMDHLVAIQQITAGLATEDWDAVQAAASRIGSSPTMAMQCEHMGAGADGFTERALDFHRRADQIIEAAGARDVPATLRATGHTLAACTECHAIYRQEVVDAASWTSQTSQEHAPGHHGG